MRKPLEGVKVVEMGTHVAVPKCARMLATWGADVIKVESPAGDPYRTWIPRGYGLPCTPDCNPVFDSENANKRSLVLDLKDPAAMEAMLKLLDTADVFICNTRMKALEKLGLTYEKLHARNPRLICAYLSGYGEFGPEKDRAGFDMQSFWSKCGAVTEWSVAGEVPFKPIPGFGDGTTGTMLCAGILAALFNREHTGEGERVHTSLTGMSMYLNSTGLLKGQPDIYTGPAIPSPRYGRGPLSTSYLTKDNKWATVTINTFERDMDNILRLLGLEDWIGTEDFSDIAHMNASAPRTGPVFAEAVSKMTAKEFVDGLAKYNLQGDVYLEIGDVHSDEQGHANGYLREVEMDNGQTVTFSQVPVAFGSLTVEDMPLEHGPKFGSSTMEILKGLGYTDEDIQTMAERKAVVAG